MDGQSLFHSLFFVVSERVLVDSLWNCLLVFVLFVRIERCDNYIGKIFFEQHVGNDAKKFEFLITVNFQKKNSNYNLSFWREGVCKLASRGRKEGDIIHNNNLSAL